MKDRSTDSYLDENLWSTSTCWRPLHQVPIIRPSTCSSQYSSLHRDTTSERTMHFTTTSQFGKHVTKSLAITFRGFPAEVKEKFSKIRTKKISCRKRDRATAAWVSFWRI